MGRVLRDRMLVCAAVAAVSTAMFAQAPQRPLSIDLIYDPMTRVDFNGAPPTDLEWLDNDSYLWKRRAANGPGWEWQRVQAATGQAAPLFEPSRMEAALASLAGVRRESAAQQSRSRDLLLNPQRNGLLVSIADDLFFYDITADRAVRLTTTGGSEDEPAFSPDGRFVAFVRGNNLFAVEIASQRERAITTDGGADTFNGKLDWLYQEEIYGRGHFRAYWWSPDSTRIAFLRLDERPVPKYTLVDAIPYRPDVDVTNYPKAGDPNPIVTLGVAEAALGEPSWVDLSAYAGLDILIVNVDWNAEGGEVVYQVQNREQTWLDLNLADAHSGRTTKVLRETTKAWVNENGNPVWLNDGSFLWLSERSGFRHLYQYRRDGTNVRQITSGRWDVRPLYGIDRENDTIYFASNEHSAIDTQLYRIKLDGTTLTRISRSEGTHRATFNPGFTRYIDVWSNAVTPAQARLHGADGAEMRVIDSNPVKALADYPVGKPEFVRVPTRDGGVMDAMMIKPPGFDPKRRYPVFEHTYSGPGTPQVRNEWGGRQYMFHQLLAQHGVIVWILDNRSASGKGAESQWPIYGRLGEFELRDLEDGVAWLKQQPYVDASHMVLSGTSYGGFMAAYALTHSQSWSAGIADAPVTDWRDYDTVYTERYMKLPANNPEGYTNTAPRFAANQLHGRLLIVHGTIDDNVHMQNTEQLSYELQKAGKTFEMMIYPKSRHGITDPLLAKHLRQTMLEFVMRSVAVSTSSSSPTASR